jgi:hypothetical protein
VPTWRKSRREMPSQVVTEPFPVNLNMESVADEGFVVSSVMIRAFGPALNGKSGVRDGVSERGLVTAGTGESQPNEVQARDKRSLQQRWSSPSFLTRSAARLISGSLLERMRLLCVRAHLVPDRTLHTMKLADKTSAPPQRS